MGNDLKPTQPKLQIWLLIPLLSLLLTFVAWDHYLNSEVALNQYLVSHVILGLGALLSVLLGYFLWSLELGRQFLEREVQRRTEQLLVQERETVIAIARTAAARQRQAELEEAYSKLKEAQDELLQAERLAAIGRVVAGVVHELSSPLVTLQGYLDRFRESESLPERVSMLEVMRRQTDRSQRMVKDLLLFLRRQEIRLSDFDLGEVIREVREAYAFEAARLKIQLMIQEPFPQCRIRADRDQLVRVLSNLIQNAMDALEGNAEERRIEIRCRPETSKTILEIADNGPGIPPENLHKIFEPFFTTKPAGKGTGLGLSLCLGILQAHGGHLAVQSDLGKGSLFTLHLSPRF